MKYQRKTFDPKKDVLPEWYGNHKPSKKKKKKAIIPQRKNVKNNPDEWNES